jgi:Nuclear cap-binding protein subunit 3/Tho1/MOS11 C-terminal domain
LRINSFLIFCLLLHSKLTCRAEKFGVDYRDPGRRREFRDDARKEKIDPSRGLGTGFDLFTSEEVEKRQQRAERFNMPDTGLQWNPPEVPEDEEKKKARAERFGVEYQAPDADGLMDVDLFETRKEAPPEVPRRPEAVHIYGVDLMSTSDLLKYFKDYGPTYVEWLNDSSANVLFKDGPTAKRAIAGLGKPLPLEDLPEGVDGADPANIQYLWHKGEDFMKAGSNLPLVFRMATILDVKPSERVQSRRLWLSAGGGGGNNRGSRGGRKFHKVRRSQDGTAMQQQQYGGGGGRGGGRRGISRAPPGWQHDDRFGFDGGEGGGKAIGEIKGRGQTRFNKRKSGDGGDQLMRDVGGAGGGGQRQKVEGNAAPMPDRDTVSYDDL